MLLAIDIGNTNTVVGIFEGSRLKDHFRVGSNHAMTIDECGFFVTGLLSRLNIEMGNIKKVVIASVVPRLTPIFEAMSQKYLKVAPLIVTSKTKLPIRIGYLDPTAVGADRLANAVAGFVKFGGPIIIVDYGTATTFDVVTDSGCYIGGVIAPGPETSASELARKAARLFEVRMELPDRVIGRTTAESLKSGLFHGTIGQVDYIIGRILEEMKSPMRVIATGGLSPEFAPHSQHIESYDPTLTLGGLQIIADYQDGILPNV